MPADGVTVSNTDEWIYCIIRSPALVPFTSAAMDSGDCGNMNGKDTVEGNGGGWDTVEGTNWEGILTDFFANWPISASRSTSRVGRSFRGTNCSEHWKE